MRYIKKSLLYFCEGFMNLDCGFEIIYNQGLLVLIKYVERAVALFFRR